MTNLYQHKRSSTPGSVPTAGQIAVGEIAINLADKKLFSKDSTNTVFEFAGGSSTNSAWNRVTSSTTMIKGARYIAVNASTVPFNMTVPAAMESGDSFIVTNSTDSVGSVRVVIGAGRQFNNLAIGDDIVIAPGETLTTVASSSTELDIIAPRVSVVATPQTEADASWIILQSNTTLLPKRSHLNPPFGDPSWANVKAFLQFNGTNGSTSFIDATGRSWTAVGNSQIVTDQSRFGGASGRFDGSGDYISSPTVAGDSINTGNFTIQFWVRWNSFGSFRKYIICADSASAYWDFNHDSTLGPSLYISGFVPLVQQGNNTGWSTGVWYHVAIVRNGNNFTIYRDGVSVATATSSSSLGHFGTLTIGGTQVDLARSADAWIDSLEFTPGVARYTSNFTPPSIEPQPGTDSRLHSLPASINAGDWFRIATKSANTVISIGAGRQLDSLGVGNNYTVPTNTAITIVAANNSQLFVVS